MSFGGPNNQVLIRKPPINGSFPLDHDGECRNIVKKYLECLKQSCSDQGACRELAKVYFSCRMASGLMDKEEWRYLGFKDSSTVDISNDTIK
jgi:cytochrome c oxidase assembly protein subunit 19